MQYQKTIILALTVAVLALLAGGGFFLVPPPVEGYYRFPMFDVLDGSTAYLRLHDGIIYEVRLSPYNPDTCRPVATYVNEGRAVEAAWPLESGGILRCLATPGWLILTWEKSLAPGGEESLLANRRVLNPLVIRRIQRTAETFEPTSGVDAHTSRGTP